MKDKAPESGKLVDREFFVNQFLCLSKNLLTKHLPERATETDFMRESSKLLSTKFNDAVGVLHAQR